MGQIWPNSMGKRKQTYQSPTLTIVEFRAEQGYVLSDPLGIPQDGMLELLMLESVNSREETESFTQHEYWTEGSNGFWEEPDGHF